MTGSAGFGATVRLAVEFQTPVIGDAMAGREGADANGNRADCERLVTSYIAALRVDLHPDALLFRTRLAVAYSRETLGHDFAAVRKMAFPGDKRRLMDMRRSGVVEAIAGDAGPMGLAAKLANSIGRLNTLHKTYAPVDIQAVRNTDDARLKGRQSI